MPATPIPATARFSNRITDYIQYRPRYPQEILDLLAARCDLTPDSIIADIGSGTGIVSQLFLDNGNPVIGVEPNRDMREAAEKLLAEYSRFKSLDGTAEATRLPGHAMDFVLAAQAFHWFDRERTREEFIRILKPEGWCVLLWNDRRTESSSFLREYEKFLKNLGTDYQEVSHKNVQNQATLSAFFGGDFEQAQFDNFQYFDLEGFIGRVASSSYCPPRDSVEFPAVIKKLTALFDRYAIDDRVTFEYDTVVYFSPMR